MYKPAWTSGRPRLADLRERYRHQIAGSRSRAPEVVDLLFDSPIISGPVVARHLNISGQGAKYLLDYLEAQGVIRDLGERLGRRRSWIAGDILEAVTN